MEWNGMNNDKRIAWNGMLCYLNKYKCGTKGDGILFPFGTSSSV